MARLPRVVIADVAHHVTQRGNARQVIFGGDPDRIAYLELLRQHCALYRLSLLGYCLMSNHVHLIVIPRAAHSLAQALKHTHGRYAAYWNARQSSSGHMWRRCLFPSSTPGRFSSLDRAALRGVESSAGRHGSSGCAMEVVERRGTAAVHPHRPAAGEHRLRCRAGTIHFAAARPAQARPPWEAHP